MMKVQPIYKCRRCGVYIYGKTMEISQRENLNDLLVDVMDMAPPMFEPHECDQEQRKIEGSPTASVIYGVLEYVGVNVL